jgi:GT2 family glycosyltransferase
MGRFDRAMFMYFEDKDICARAWAEGMTVLFEPAITLTHIKGGSSPAHLSPRLKTIYRRSQIRYYQKHRTGVERVLLSAFLRLTRQMPDG